MIEAAAHLLLPATLLLFLRLWWFRLNRWFVIGYLKSPFSFRQNRNEIMRYQSFWPCCRLAIRIKIGIVVNQKLLVLGRVLVHLGNEQRIQIVEFVLNRFEFLIEFLSFL